jgi:hypothetical protein
MSGHATYPSSRVHFGLGDAKLIDILPEITGDTLTCSVYANDNPGVLNVEPNESDLILTAGNEGGTSKISFVVSAGFARKLDSFMVTVKHVEYSGTYASEADIKIYPNPARDDVNIELPSSYNRGITVELNDIKGTAIFKEEYKTVQAKTIEKIDLTYIPAGIYFVKIKQENCIRIEKLIISK